MKVNELPSTHCPITLERMSDPYMAADGHSYERKALQRWLRQSSLSPATGAPLANLGMTPNHALRNLILESTSTNSAIEVHCQSPAKCQTHGIIPLGSLPALPSLRGWALGGVLHGALHLVFRLPDVDLALSYACLGKDHGALLVLGFSMLLCALGAWLRDELMVFAAVLSGVPLSALSFSCGMVTALGSEASALMMLLRFVLLASVFFCGIGLFLAQRGTEEDDLSERVPSLHRRNT